MEFDLKELQEQKIPRLDYKKVLTIDPEDKSLFKEADKKLTEYFSRFADFENNSNCIGCKRKFQMFMGLKWGFVHGEAHCVWCKYPYRGIHRIEDVINVSNVFLPYHPEDLECVKN